MWALNAVHSIGAMLHVGLWQTLCNPIYNVFGIIVESVFFVSRWQLYY